MHITIQPLSGITLNGQVFTLGMPEAEIIALLGEPEAADENRIFYFESELRFDLDADGRLEFIEFLGGFDGELQPEICGVPAFQVHADELTALLTRENNGAVIDDEDGYSYAFPSIGIGVYRESLPEDVEEMRAEAEDDGEPLSDEVYQEELAKAVHWATIGCGGRDYYN